MKYPPTFWIGIIGTIIIATIGFYNYYRQRKWMKEQDIKVAKRLEELKCQRGNHDWRMHEAHSMMSPICEMGNVPVKCFRCKVTATAHWIPGEGLSQVVLD